jgi:HlyD family secretion protein
MAVPKLKLASKPSAGMDRKIHHKPWSPARWPLGAKIGVAATAIAVVALLAVRLIAGSGVRTLRIPLEQVTLATVRHGVFHDLIPLRANVVPRQTIYVDATDGGRVDRVLVEPGDLVQEAQPIIVLSNTNLALQVIQQESQLNQAISQLQQNEIALEENQLANDRALADIDYNLVRLNRSAERRESLASKGLVSPEQRDVVTDELAYYKRLRPIQANSNERQSDLRARLLPGIHEQLKNLRDNLTVVHDKLDSLVVRAPVAGKVTAIDLKVGEALSPGQRLAEVTPQRGMKLIADVDEFYLHRVRVDQIATIILDGNPVNLTVRRVYPQVVNGLFRVDLDFQETSPPMLVEGATAQGQLQLGGDTPATILPAGAFLQHTGGDWIFVVGSDGRSAERQRIKLGRRTSEQLEVLGGLRAGQQVITSDYTGFDKVDRIVFTR